MPQQSNKVQSVHLDLSRTYKRRFQNQLEFRNHMWAALCTEYFQKFIPPDSTVLELAAGYCEFINNIKAGRKIAVDLNPDTKLMANEGVAVIQSKSSDLSAIPENSVNRIFVSNFFEHITKEEMTLTLQEAFRVLRVGGQILILQPNIRFIYKDYWMFYDHINPVDDRALCEILEVVGFKVKLDVPRFLPFTTHSSLPKSIPLVRLYLKIPILWKVFGGQAFVIAEK